MKSVPLHAAELSIGRAGRLPGASAMYMVPDWLHEPFGWAEHIPFAFWIMECHRPAAVVELGTHFGNSYFAFCQAAAALQIPTACYAIDTWRGDEHAGFYGDAVYETVERYNRARYNVFSRLVRSTFDEARPHFADGSIDLLHIDGLHTYEACKHDFDNWLPAMSDRGVVLMHDTNVRERNFGVGRLWSELRDRYPHFEFSHGNGLGILGVGDNLSDTLKELFSAERNDRIATSTRHIFWRIGAALTSQATVDEQAAALAKKAAESTAKDEELQRKGDELERRAEDIACKTAELGRQAETLDRNSGELSRQQAEIAARDKVLAGKDDAIAERDRALAGKDDALAAKELALGEQHADLARGQAEIAEALQQLQRTEAALHEQHSRVQELETERTRLLEIENELRAQSNALEKAAQSALRDQERSEHERSELRAQSRVLDKAAQSAVRGQEHSEHERSLLRGRLNAAYERIAEVETAGRAGSKELSGLRSLIEIEETKAANLSASLAETESKLATLTSLLAEADRALGDAKYEITERDKGIERLQREKLELSEVAHLQFQGLIAHFRNSTSWKVTRPLRAVRQLLPKQAPKTPGTLQSHGAKSHDAAGVIAESGLFNFDYYLARAGRTMRDPIAHYIETGHKSGLNPNPLFDSDYYSTLYAGHLEDGANPLVHFIQTGSERGFDPSRLFQTQFYLQSNPDIELEGISPLLHYLTVGRVMGLMPIDIDAEKLDPRALQLHRLNLAHPDGDEFDADVYGELNLEVSPGDRSPGALLRHYETIGRAEGRIASRRAFLQSVKLPPEAVPVNFTPAEYYELNADLGRALPCTFYLALRHYLEFGIREGRRYSFSQCYIDAQWRQETKAAVTAKPRPDGANKRIACLIHVYYADLWPALRAYLSNLDPPGRHVYVNITDSVWTEELHAQIRNDVPDAHIVVSENRGRDIGGHLSSLKGIRMDDYAAFVLLHTKKSRHFSEKYSENWRNSLIEPLLGTPERIANNIELMAADKSIGIVGAAAWRHKGVDQNAKHYRYLLHKAGIDPADADCDYVSGTMMMVRPNVLQRVYDLLSDEEFENAEGKSDEWLRDGQLEHSAERLFGNVCKALGCRILWR